MYTKNILISLLFLLPVFQLACYGQHLDLADFEKSHKNRGFTFNENTGQVVDQFSQPRTDVLFNGTSAGLNFYIRTNGISYQLHGREKQNDSLESIQRVDIDFLDCKTNAEVVRPSEVVSQSIFYKSGSSDPMVSNEYSEVTLQSIYDGIDVRYYEKDAELKYDFIVAAGANYKAIVLNVKGADVSIKKDGSLEYSTPAGTIYEAAPVVFQGNKTLEAKWLISDGHLTFDIKNVDPTKDVVIDPSVGILNWSTYYGGTNDDVIEDVIVDGVGSIYVVGTTRSSTQIATTGAYQVSYSAFFDSFIAKFDGAGQRIFGTYFGGANSEHGKSIALDTQGNIAFVGETNSQSGLSTSASFQLTSGGSYDLLVGKFSSTGFRIWMTYFGGSGLEFVNACTTDANDDIYLAGRTNSSSNIATISAHQQTRSGGYDGLVAKFSSSGNLLWSTYYGGTAADEVRDIDINANDELVFVGHTASSNNISTPGSNQTTYISGYASHSFAVKMESSGSVLWGTYFGGGSTSYAYACALDDTGTVYMGGKVNGSGNIGGIGVHQNTYNGSGDGYLVKYTSAGTKIWSSFYGGSGEDFINAIEIQANGDLLVGGSTKSTGAIATPDGFNTTLAGNTDGFIAKLTSNCVRIRGSYIGGSNNDIINGLTIDTDENIIVAGETTSTNLPTTTASHQNTYAGASGFEDGFIYSLSNCSFTYDTIDILTTRCDPVTFPSGITLYPAEGEYNEVLTNAGGCDSLINITISYILADTTISRNGSDLTGIYSPNFSYQWIDCNTLLPLPGETSNFFHATVNIYCALVIYHNGCSDTSSCYDISVLSIENTLPTSSLSFYPNPSSTSITVESSNNESNIAYSIYDLVGNLVKKGTVVNGKINIEELDNASYIIELSTGSTTLRKTLIKQH